MLKMPKMKKGQWTCDCLACSLVRAGACLDCAGAIQAQVEQMTEPGTIMAPACSGSCREAIEQFFADPLMQDENGTAH
jgi:hypothetical protein